MLSQYFNIPLTLFRNITIGVFGLDDAGKQTIFLHVLVQIIHLGKTSIVKAIEGGKILPSFLYGLSLSYRSN